MAIPWLPQFKAPGEVAAEAIPQYQDILSKILQGKQAQQKIEQEKLANEQLNQYRQKEIGLKRELQPLNLELLKAKINAANKAGMNDLTKSTITTNQSIVENSQNFIDQLDDLMKQEIPNQITGSITSPNDQIAYEARTGGMADAFLGAQKLPKTDQSLALAKQMLRRGKVESYNAYIKRLQNLKKDTEARRDRALSILKSNNIQGGNEIVPGEETKVLDGITYIKKNGVWHKKKGKK